MDYYSLLGVDKSAAQSEIKKAYRKKAKELHPDRNPGDANAEARFKEASEAYNVLSDPEKRRLYDQYGKEAFDGKGQAKQSSNPFSGFGGFDGFEDIFASFFGARSQQASGPNLDIHEEMVLDMSELIQGARRNVVIPGRQVECKVCDGKGAQPGTKPTICPDCHGHGSITANRGFMTFTQTCPTCQGKGSIIKYPCKSCHGAGYSADTSEKTIDIPYGLRPGQTIRITGGGHEVSGRVGSLYLKILVNPSEFQISGDNLLKEVGICCLDACAGATIPVKTFDGTKKVKIPPGVQLGTKIKMSGLGLPKSPTNPSRGDMYISVSLTVPFMSESQQNTIKKIKKEIQQGQEV